MESGNGWTKLKLYDPDDPQDLGEVVIAVTRGGLAEAPSPQTFTLNDHVSGTYGVHLPLQGSAAIVVKYKEESSRSFLLRRTVVLDW